MGFSVIRMLLYYIISILVPMSFKFKFQEVLSAAAYSLLLIVKRMLGSLFALLQCELVVYITGIHRIQYLP